MAVFLNQYIKSMGTLHNCNANRFRMRSVIKMFAYWSLSRFMKKINPNCRINLKNYKHNCSKIIVWRNPLKTYSKKSEFPAQCKLVGKEKKSGRYIVWNISEIKSHYRLFLQLSIIFKAKPIKFSDDIN